MYLCFAVYIFYVVEGLRQLMVSSFIGVGDDCIAINNGSAYINITNIACGPGHGIRLVTKTLFVHFMSCSVVLLSYVRFVITVWEA